MLLCICSVIDHARVLLTSSLFTFHYELKIHHLYSFITLVMTLIVLILAVCRMPVTHELS